MFRLTYAIEALKAQGWINAAVVDAEWDIPTLLNEYADASVLLVRKSDLVRHFNDAGQLTGEIDFVVQGTLDTVTAAFDAQSLRYSTKTTVKNHTGLTLCPPK